MDKETRQAHGECEVDGKLDEQYVIPETGARAFWCYAHQMMIYDYPKAIVMQYDDGTKIEKTGIKLVRL